LSAHDPLRLLGVLDQLVDALPADVAERHLHVHLIVGQLALPGELAEAVELLGDFAEDFLQEVFAEVPVPHLQIHVFLDDGVAGFAEDGGEGGEAQIGFGGVPVGREDEHHLHLPAGGFEGGLALELDQLLGGSVTLRIFNPHTGLTPLANRMKLI